MVTRRDIGVSFAPAKRAAVWPRPPRAGPLAGALALAAGRGGMAHHRLAAAGLASLLQHLGNEALALALAPVLRGAGRTRKSSSRRSVMAARKLRRVLSCEARGHACIARASRPTRHGGEAAPCRATPCADRLSTRPGAASFCLPPLPFAVAQGVGGPAALCCSQPAGERADGRAGAAGRARSRQDACTVDGCAGCCAKRGATARAARATTRRQQPERHARWHDERHGNVQRIGGRHGRVSSLTGCATPITADALTGPK